MLIDKAALAEAVRKTAKLRVEDVGGRKERPAETVQSCLNRGYPGLGSDEGLSYILRHAIKYYLATAQSPIVVKPLEWREITSPREAGPAEPTGDIEALDHMGDYSVSFDADEEMIETPWVAYSPMENLGHFGTPEEARSACDQWRSAAIISSLALEPKP